MTTMEKAGQSGTIRSGERTELRRLVRLHVKLLRSQIAERHAVQMAQIDGRVAAKFCEDRTRIDALHAELDRLVARANRQAEAIIAKYPDIAEPRVNPFSRPWIHRPEQGKDQLRRAMVAGVCATTEAAKLKVSELETELMSVLALDALQTEAAQEFFRRIPEIDELVPAEQLAEIESRFDAKAVTR